MDELRTAIRDALGTYSDSDAHSRANTNGNPEGCNAHDEGQWCCIDVEHPGFGQLLDVIVAAVQGARAS